MPTRLMPEKIQEIHRVFAEEVELRGAYSARKRTAERCRVGRGAVSHHVGAAYKVSAHTIPPSIAENASQPIIAPDREITTGPPSQFGTVTTMSEQAAAPFQGAEAESSLRLQAIRLLRQSPISAGGLAEAGRFLGGICLNYHWRVGLKKGWFRRAH